MKLPKAIEILPKLAHECALDISNSEYGKVSHMLSALGRCYLFKGPYAVSIEPVNACNLDCEFCSTPPSRLRRKKRALSLGEFKAIVRGLPNSVHYLWLFFGGEPLLNNALPEMVRHASEKGLKTIVSTNANLLSRDVSRRLINARLDRLIVSLDSVSAENYGQMRRGGDLKKVMRNLNALAEEKRAMRSSKPEIELQMIATKINSGGEKEFAKFAESIGAKCAVKSFAIPAWAYSEKEIGRMVEKFLPEGYAAKAPAKGCSFTRKGIILSDGRVCACCYDFFAEHCFGNAIETPFAEIWDSEAFRNARVKMKMRALPICKNCADARD